MPSISFKPPFIAHRGASNFAPENTLAAFSKVKELGAKWIEFDVVLAASGEAIVFHDDTLDRTTNGKGNVWDFPYSYLKTLDAGSWFSPEFSGERIPTFKSVIEVVERDKLTANVEIKPAPGQEEATVKKVLSEIELYWTDAMLPPLISSFSVESLRLVRQFAPGAMIGLLIHEWFDDWESVAVELRATSVNLNHEIVDAEKVKVIHAMGKLVVCYTVNDPERARELFAWGVDAVFTDHVDLMMLGEG